MTIFVGAYIRADFTPEQKTQMFSSKVENKCKLISKIHLPNPINPITNFTYCPLIRFCIQIASAASLQHLIGIYKTFWATNA